MILLLASGSVTVTLIGDIRQRRRLVRVYTGSTTGSARPQTVRSQARTREGSESEVSGRSLTA